MNERHPDTTGRTVGAGRANLTAPNTGRNDAVSDAPSTYDVKQYIEDRMAELVWQGLSTPQAAEVVISEIKDGNLLEQFLEQIGPAAVAAFWRQDLSLRRMERRYVRVSEEEGATGVPEAIEAIVPRGWDSLPADVTAATAAPGEAPAPTLDAVMDEMIFKVAGRWVRLGDVRRDDALWLAETDRRRAERAGRRAAAWTRVAEEIGNGTVRERFGALELRVLLAAKKD